MSQPVIPPALHEDARTRAVRVLTDAYAYDVIDEAEFERRLGLLGLQESAIGIATVVADLPKSAEYLSAIAEGMRPTLRDDARIIGFMSETGRKGQWRVPPTFTVNAFMCDMKLDLRYASIAPGCIVTVSAFMSNVSLIVPPGMLVEFRVDAVLASVGSDADDGPGYAGGAAHVQVRGTAIMSEVKVRVRGYR